MPARKTRKTEIPDTPSLRSPSWTRWAWPLLILWILTFAAYSDSFDGALVFDNAAIIGHDPRIREATLENAGRIFTSGYWYDNPGSALYRPLTTFSYLINYTRLDDGLQPAGYHSINLLLHEINVALAFALGLAIFGSSAWAFALAAIWALHPLLSESITNIVGRADLLAGLGVLGGLWCYIRALSSFGNRKIAWFAALALAQTIGIFSKENAAILPLALILYDVAWPAATALKRRLVPYAVLAIPLAVYALLRMQLHARMVIPFSENPLVGAPFWTARITALKVIGKFLYLFLWPTRLSADYSFNAIPLFAGTLTWQDSISIAACLGLIGLALFERKRQPALFFFLGFSFLALLPTSNLLIPIGSIMAERFMYLPALGLAGCVILAIRRIPGAALQWAAIGLICVAFGARTYARNADWHDSVALWTSAIDAYPNAARPHNNLGSALLEKSDVANAIPQFEAALRIRPDYAEAHLNLGIALAQLPGRLDEAIAQYQQALAGTPDYSPKIHATNAHIDLGNALAHLPGRIADAIAQYHAALEIDPDSAQAHYNLGNTLARTVGHVGDAVSEWQAAIRLDPNLALAHYNLATVYAQSGHREEAVAEYLIAQRLRPNFADAYNNLGGVYSQMPGRANDAIAQYEQAVRLRPDFAEAHYNLGMALLKSPGHSADALRELEAALRLHPDPQGQRMVDELRAQQKY